MYGGQSFVEWSKKLIVVVVVELMRLVYCSCRLFCWTALLYGRTSAILKHSHTYFHVTH